MLESLSPPHLGGGLVSAGCLESLVLEGDTTRKRRAEVIDSLAAQIILQTWLSENPSDP